MAESKTFLGKILDKFIAPPIPFDMTVDMNKVRKDMEQVQSGQITDPLEIERINKEYQDWVVAAQIHISNRTPIL